MDEAPTLREAFECFDEKDDGVIDTAELRLWLSEVGDKMTDDEVGIQAVNSSLSPPLPRFLAFPTGRMVPRLTTHSHLARSPPRRLIDSSRAPSWIEQARSLTIELVSGGGSGVTSKMADMQEAH